MNPVERLSLGLAIVGAVLDPRAGSEVAEVTPAALEAGIPLIISGLQKIRFDETIPEAAKLGYAHMVFRSIDFQEISLDKEPIRLLFVETWRTIVAGVKTPLLERIDNLEQQWQDGMLSLVALLHLGDKRGELAIGEELSHIDESLGQIKDLTGEERRNILIAWAKHNVTRESSESEVSEMIQFFFDRDDVEASNEVRFCYLREKYAPESSIAE